MDFNLTDNENVYGTTLKVLNRRAKEKDFVQSFFAKSPAVYEDLKITCQNRAWFVCKIKKPGSQWPKSGNQVLMGA